MVFYLCKVVPVLGFSTEAEPVGDMYRIYYQELVHMIMEALKSKVWQAGDPGLLMQLC